MAKPITYREQEKIENTVKLREFLMELPPYVKDYFRAKEPTTSDKTRLSYAYDLRVFFRFLQLTNPALKEKPMTDISIQDLSLLQPVDFEEFEEYLKAYKTPTPVQELPEKCPVCAVFMIICANASFYSLILCALWICPESRKKPLFS